MRRLYIKAVFNSYCLINKVTVYFPNFQTLLLLFLILYVWMLLLGAEIALLTPINTVCNY
jgi:hypothetical protein